MPSLDLLELFAFAMPARAAAPTPRGLALALDMNPAAPGAEAGAGMLPDIARALLARLQAGRDLPINRDAAGLAARMGQAGWDWAPFVLAALGRPGAAPLIDALRVWKRLPEWEEIAPQPAPSSQPVAPAEARTRLAAMLGEGAEQRPGQSDYAAAAAAAFAPRESRGDPHVVLAEAGTGTGKTLGYIAPASLWAERNKGAGVDLHLHPPPAAPGGKRIVAAGPRPRGAPPPDRRAERTGKLPVPAEPRGRGRRGGRGVAAVGDPARPDRPLGVGDLGR